MVLATEVESNGKKVAMRAFIFKAAFELLLMELLHCLLHMFFSTVQLNFHEDSIPQVLAVFQ